MKEIWEQYIHGYKVSNFGNVLDANDNEVTMYVNSSGCLYFYVNAGEKLKFNIGLHRVVAELFIPNPNNYHYIDFVNGNKQNCRSDNLEWVRRIRRKEEPANYKNKKIPAAIIKELLEDILLPARCGDWKMSQRKIIKALKYYQKEGVFI